MSLEMMYAPLVNHIRMERVMHRSGHVKIAKLVLRIINTMMDGVVPDEMLMLDAHTKWSRVTPKNRMDLVNELTLRRQVTLADQQNSLMRLTNRKASTRMRSWQTSWLSSR